MRRWAPTALAVLLLGLLAGIGTTSAAFTSTASNAGSRFATGLFPPVLVLIPHAQAAPVRGETLTATDGTWTRADRYTRQWLRCTGASSGTGTGCTPIAGATGTSYVLATADVGAYVAVRVTAQNGATGPTTQATSLVTGRDVTQNGPTMQTAPVVTGPSGTTYSTTTGTWGPGGISLLGLAGTFTINTPSRQWYRCDAVGASCVAIAGATDPTYARTAADVGRRLRVRVAQPWSVLTVIGISLLNGETAAWTQATPVVP